MKVEYLQCINGLVDEIMEQYSKDGRCEWDKVINIAAGIIDYAHGITEDAAINMNEKKLKVIR